MLHTRHIRAAAGLVVQEDRGLRPGEILGIKGTDIVLPEEVPDTNGAAVLLLGMRAGTKANRAQGVQVHSPFVIAVLRELRCITGSMDRIVPLVLSAYNSCIYEACLTEGIGQQGWSGHSARFGFVTALFLKDGVEELIERTFTRIRV